MSNERVFQATAPIASFVVDTAQDIFFSTTANSLYQLSASGELNQYPLSPTNPLALALDLNRNLYFADASGLNEVKLGPVNFGGELVFPYDATPSVTLNLIFAACTSAIASATLSTLRTNNNRLTLLSDIKEPKGVAGNLSGPTVADEASGQLLTPNLPNSAFNFGNVPLGGTASQTFALLALGNVETTGEFQIADPQFTVSPASYSIKPGGSAMFTVTYKPTTAGVHNATLTTYQNDDLRPDGAPSYFCLNGVGGPPPVADPTKGPTENPESASCCPYTC